MGALSVLAAAHGTSLRVIAQQLGVSVALLDRADAGEQALPSDLVPEIAAVLGEPQGTVVAAAGRTIASEDRVVRRARVPAIVRTIGPSRLHRVVQPVPLVVRPPR